MTIEKAEQFILLDDPTLPEIAMELTFLANNLSRLQELVAKYKIDTARAKTRALREESTAHVLYRAEKNQALIKARVALYDAVIKANDDLDIAEAKLIKAQGELAGCDAQFVAVRKQAELKKLEVEALNGGE